MNVRRTLTPLVATVAAAALSVGGVFLVASPVSAAPVQSDECITALTALGDEFGDVDFEVAAELEAELNALFEAYEGQSNDLNAQLELLFADVFADEEVASENFIAATDERNAAQATLTANLSTLAQAEIALEAALGTDAEAGARTARDTAAAAVMSADADLATANEALVEAQEALDAVEAAFEEIAEEAAVIEEAILALDEEFNVAIEELLGELPEIEIERLLELLTDVALECTVVVEDVTPIAGPESGPVGIPVTTPSAPVGSAPVATPMPGRATFTG